VTYIRDLADLVRARVPSYADCSEEQALTYACEDVVIDVLGSRSVPEHELTIWIADVCEREDVDTPVLVFLPKNGRITGSTDIDGNVMCLRGRTPSVAVVLHELAHVVSRAPNHDTQFRSSLIGMWRRHLSVEHAALLHSLYGATELHVDSWM